MARNAQITERPGSACKQGAGRSVPVSLSGRTIATAMRGVEFEFPLWSCRDRRGEGWSLLDVADRANAYVSLGIGTP